MSESSSQRSTPVMAWILAIVAVPVLYVLAFPPVYAVTFRPEFVTVTKSAASRHRPPPTTLERLYCGPFFFLYSNPPFDKPLKAYMRWWARRI